MLSASDASGTVLVKTADLIPILLASSATATDPAGDSQGQGGPTSGLIAVSTPGATGVSIVSIHTVGGTVNLPDVASPSVVDVISTVSAANVYQVTDLTDASSVEMDLQSLPDTDPIADQLTVFAASGTLVGVLTRTDSATAESLTVLTAQVPEPGAGLFIKVDYSIDPASGQAPFLGAQPAYFLLRITRQEVAPTSPNGTPPGAPLSGPLPHPPSPPSESNPGSRPPSSPPLPEQFVAAPPTSADAPAVDVRTILAPGWPSGTFASPSPVSTGPLPMRSAAALGGVLASGDPVPRVDRADAAVIDLALIGLVPGEPEGPRASPAGPEEDTAASSGRLDLVRGPGGFPLLASAPSRSLAAPPMDSPWASDPRTPEADTRPVGPPTAPATTSTRPGARSHSSAGSDLTMALSLVFGLVLPDLADAHRRDEPPPAPGPPRPSRRRGSIGPHPGD